MRNRAFLKVVLLGLLTFVLVPGIAGAAGQDLTGMLMLSSSAAERATAVSNAFISVTPSSHDFGRVNVGASSGSFLFNVSNTGTATLNVSALNHSNPGAGFSASLSSTSIAPGGSATLTTSYTPSGSGPQSDNVSIVSNADNGTFVVLLQGIANNAPVFNPAIAPSYALDAFVAFSLTASATDSEGDPLSWSVGGLPVGATFDGSTGTLNWTPQASDAGPHPISITVSDGSAQSVANTSLDVTAANNPPTANPGGPYEGGTTQLINFDGTGSSDPDAGQSLTYSWNFGDGGTGSGATVQHAYANPGTFFVNLTVTDDGSPPLQDTGTTFATIVTLLPAQCAAKLPGNGIMKAFGKGTQEFMMELNPTSGHPSSDIDVTTIRLSQTGGAPGTASSIAPLTKGTKLGDFDHDGINDLDVFFARTDLGTLFGNTGGGTFAATMVLSARTISGNLPVQGSVNVLVKVSGGQAVIVAAAPNPFKPFTNINYSLKNSGPVSIRIFSVTGQLVRSLREEFATPGAYEVRWNGKDDAGRTAPSGIYFVSVKQGLESSTHRVVLAR